jgi:putative membrane protein
MRLILHWLILAVAVVAAVYLLPGIEIQGENGWLAVLLMAAVLGFVNAFIRPILAFISCGLVAITLGLFLFVVNALAFWFASWLTVNIFGTGIVIDGFWPALWGSILVSLISTFLSMFVPDNP